METKKIIELRPMKTVFIGCGNIVEIYMKNAIEKFQILDVYGCCDLDQEKAKKCASFYNIRSLTMEEILADDTIELVINLTSPRSHYTVIRQLLESGKHVYTEKLLASTLEEAAELVRIANENRRELCVAPDTFLGAAIQNARQLVDRGMLGKVTGCRVSLTRNSHRMAEILPYLAEEGGDLGLDVAIYHITALIYMLGPVKSVCGYARTNDPERMHYLTARSDFGQSYEMKAKTVTVGCLEFECGTLGTMLFNSDSLFAEQPDFTLMGQYGILNLKNPDEFGGDVMLRREGVKDPIAVPSTFVGEENLRGIGAAEMAWAIRLGRKPRANKEMSYHALEVLMGIKISSETGRKYQLTSTFERLPQLQEGYVNDPFMPEYEASLLY